MPAVSAILVFHRDTPFLRPAVESLLGQTWRDLELVLVDNGTGLTAEALGGSGRDPRLRWVRLPENRGIPAGHNAGVAAAQGEFIALLDHDDLALPRRVEAQVAALRAEPELGLVSSRAETIDEGGAVVGREFSLESAAAQRAYSQFAAPVVTPAYSGRRELFERLPYRAEFPLAADFDFLARAAEVAPMQAVPEVLLRYRRHARQATGVHAAEIEAQRGAIRLLTAQRRRGEGEKLAWVLGQRVNAVSPAAAALAWAEVALRAQVPWLAAYQARRAVALEGRPAIAGPAARLAWRAVVAARGADRRLALRLWFRGPVRVLGLVGERGRAAGRADG